MHQYFLLRIYFQVDINVGNGYDVRHGTFVAPVGGVYDFTAASLIAGGSYVGIEMVHNNVVVAKTSSGDSSYYTMGTMVAALKLKKGTVTHNTVKPVLETTCIKLSTALTHYHTIPHFSNALKINSCAKHCEKRRNCL